MAYMYKISVALIICCAIQYTESKPANLVKLENPGDAVCLDGTPPGYYYRAGTGNSTRKFIIHLEGGGWCYDEEACLERSKTNLGSSKSWPPTADFGGFLSDSPGTNPDFYDWNVVFVMYCDGASFTGNVNHPVIVQGTTIYFRGFKILQAILEDLLKKGMRQADEVILTGCSAGGIATYYHADYVQSVLPPSIKYHALADAGYMINISSVKSGEDYAEERAKYVFKMQNTTGSINQKCVADTDQDELWKCMGSQYAYSYISSPIFALNSQYDTWQIKNLLEVNCHPPLCTIKEMEEIQNFHKEFKLAAQPVIDSATNGAFLDSCFKHCQSLDDHSWNGIKVGGQTAAETFGNWYFKRSGNTKEVDCAYPCNISC